MATVAEIQARWAARDAKSAPAQKPDSDKPDGFIRVSGKFMAVWLNGNDPKEMGLKTFVREARAFGKGKAA